MKRSLTFRHEQQSCYNQQQQPLQLRHRFCYCGETPLPSSCTQDVGMLASSMMMVSISDHVVEGQDDDDEGNMSRSSSSSSTSVPSSVYHSDRSDGTLSGWGSVQSRASYKIDLCSLGGDEGEHLAETRRKRRHCLGRCGTSLPSGPPPPPSPESYFPALYSDLVPPSPPSSFSPSATDPSSLRAGTTPVADASWGYYVDAVTPGRSHSTR